MLKQLKLNVQLALSLSLGWTWADLSSTRHALIIANILSYIVINRRPIIVMCINQMNASLLPPLQMYTCQATNGHVVPALTRKVILDMNRK